jgi:erythromycin esterase
MKNFFLLSALLIVLNGPQAMAQKAVELQNGFQNDQFLAKDQNDSYTLNLTKGGFARINLMQNGVDVMVDAYDPAGQKLKTFDSPNGNAGPERIQIEAKKTGLYRLVVHGFDDPTGVPDSLFRLMTENNQGRYAITSVQILTAGQYREQLKKEKAEEEAVIRLLDAEAIPLKSVIAGSGFDDLQPLKSILSGVQFVGLGEATHGTREFFRMKHRMLEFLVTEMGFTVFAMEASYAGCQNINDYVLYGKGDARTALASQGFWTWDTEEVVDMIEWMRTYNQSVPDAKKVRFAGFDIQVNELGGGIARLEAYLQKVDTLRYRGMKPLLDSIESSANTGNNEKGLNAVKNFLAFFTMSRGYYVSVSSASEYETALAYCRTLVQLLDAYMMSPSDPWKQEREWRDYYMASNFLDLTAHDPPGTKYVLWAHNGHVAINPKGAINGGVRPFGSYLKAAFGDRYYAFGFSFSSGGFQAMEFDSTGTMKGLQEFTARPAREKSLDGYLARTGQSIAVFNFRNAALPENVRSFLYQPQETRNFGSGTRRDWVDQMYDSVVPAETYDGMIFISTTRRAIPTATGMRKGK